MVYINIKNVYNGQAGLKINNNSYFTFILHEKIYEIYLHHIFVVQ